MSNKSLFAFLAGAAMGAATAWFLSSEKTAGTRENIREEAEKAYDKVKTAASEAEEKIKDAAHKAGQKICETKHEKLDPIKAKVIEGLDAAENAIQNI